MFGTASIPNRPTAKLVLAAVLCFIPALIVCLIGGADAPISKLPVIVGFALSFWIWWCFYAMFRLLGLQSLLGPLFLIIGLVGVGQWMIGMIVTTISDPSKALLELRQLNLILLAGILWPLAIGYLLAIDKDITEYRRQFRHHFPAKDRLDPKVDNLPDDPINPS